MDAALPHKRCLVKHFNLTMVAALFESGLLSWQHGKSLKLEKCKSSVVLSFQSFQKK